MSNNSRNNNLKKKFKWDSLYIILVEPSKPQNLGNIARAMMNFGFSNLLLINPKLELSDSEIKIVARRAEVIINQAQLAMHLQDVRDEFEFLIGTTARIGSDYNLKRVAISPEQLWKEDFWYNKLGIVFGREQSGLSNEEIDLCDLLVTIPTHMAYSSMNISHAVAIILYFLNQKLQEISLNDSEGKLKYRAASHKERQLLMNYFEKVIKITGYHPEKQHVALQAFTNIISRGYVTGRELSTMMGVLKWVELKLQNSLQRNKRIY
ncbi:MAG: RNA methyltransferase [Promethearchaeota archaeon]